MSLDNLPVEWMNVKISDITVKGEQRKPNDSEEFIYVDIGSINRDLKKIESPQFLLGKDAPSRARKVIKSGDILVSLTRPNLNAVALVGENYDQQIASTGFEVISPMIVESKYLFSLVRTQNFINEISKQEQGALYPAAKSSDVQAYEFPLPPLAEQQEIVRQLDVMLAQVEQIKARLDAIPAILKKFRQSVLAYAVSGKLTEEWRSETKEWVSTTLAECTHRIGDGLHGTPQYVEDGEYYFVNGNNLINGEIVIKESTKSVNALEFEKHKRDLGGNTLLLSINGTIGNLAFYQNEKVILGKSACYLNFNEKMNRDFGYILLSSEFFIQYAHAVATGATIKNVPLKGIRDYKFLIPSLEEQVEIVNRVRGLLALGSAIEKKIEAAQKRVNLLTQSILAKAFSGELTAEWREQHQELITGINSAESLLAKIQKEREASKPAKKTRKKKEV